MVESAESNQTPEEAAPGVEGESGASVTPDEAEPEPQGPDLSLLTERGRETLQATLEVLREFDPQPGTLNDLPQVSVASRDTESVCSLLKNDPRIAAKMLLCLAAVDYPENLQMVYVLQSLEPERTLILKTDLPKDHTGRRDPMVPSVASVWRAADWYEREAHDLFGVVFQGHPDLSPLLLYDGFEGYPGRKEYPFYEYKEF